MLRCKSPAVGRSGSYVDASHEDLVELAGTKPMKARNMRAARNPKRLAISGFVASLSFALATGVSAESLAQPRDTALERQAAYYIQYRQDIAAVEETQFTSAEVTREAHRRLAAHEADDLAAGWVAFAALVAADTPAFAEALQNEVEPKKKKRRRRKKGELEGKDALISKMAQDPSYARNLPGAEAAIDRVLAMTVQDSSRFYNLGEAFKTQAYAMQRTAWGKAKLRTSSSQRLSEAKDFASARPKATAPTMVGATNRGVTSPDLSSVDGAWSADWGIEGGKGEMTEKNAQVVMDRILNLAARYAVGSTNEKLVSVYAKNTKANRCLSMAQLTLSQCIAATRTSYEEAFCLGEHGLNDVASCVGWVANVDAGS